MTVTEVPENAEETEPLTPSGLLAYLRLVRAPAVFSAIGDPLAGMLIARGSLDGGRVPTLALAAGSLYLAGMALNDVADREEDARARPDRPIPSGAVPVERAAAVGTALLGAGLAAAGGAGAIRTGGALAGMILAYDFALKRSAVAGPVGMGACRALSLLMGAEAGGGDRGVRAASAAALVLGVYVAGLTILAHGETESGSPESVRRGALVITSAVGAMVAVGGLRALPWVAGVAAIAGPAAIRAVQEPAPATVGPAVGAMIRAIPAIGGALASKRAVKASLVFLPLLALARWGRKLIPVH